MGHQGPRSGTSGPQEWDIMIKIWVRLKIEKQLAVTAGVVLFFPSQGPTNGTSFCTHMRKAKTSEPSSHPRPPPSPPPSPLETLTRSRSPNRWRSHWSRRPEPGSPVPTAGLDVSASALMSFWEKIKLCKGFGSVLRHVLQESIVEAISCCLSFRGSPPPQEQRGGRAPLGTRLLAK